MYDTWLKPYISQNTHGTALERIIARSAPTVGSFINLVIYVRHQVSVGSFQVEASAELAHHLSLASSEAWQVLVSIQHHLHQEHDLAIALASGDEGHRARPSELLKLSRISAT